MSIEGKISGCDCGCDRHFLRHGKSIIELFVKEGASVMAVARRKECLDSLVEGLKDAPGKVAAFAGDVSRK